jgi:hypothetical protein
MNDQEPAILRNLAAEVPVLVVLSLIDQLVLRLRRPELMEIKFMKVKCLFEFVGGGWRVVTAVEESALIFLPGAEGEFHPLHVIRQIFAGFDVAHFPVLPVRAGDRDSIRQQLAVAGYIVPAQRDGAVFRKRVGIEQRLWFTRQD